MKHFPLICILLSILFGSCSDEPNPVLGTWKLTNIKFSTNKDSTNEILYPEDYIPQGYYLHFSKDSFYQLFYPYYTIDVVPYYFKNDTIHYEDHYYTIDWINDTLRLIEDYHFVGYRYQYFVKANIPDDDINKFIADKINWSILKKDWHCYDFGYGKDTSNTCGFSPNMNINLSKSNSSNYYINGKTLFYNNNGNLLQFSFSGSGEYGLVLSPECDSLSRYDFMFYEPENGQERYFKNSEP